MTVDQCLDLGLRESSPLFLSEQWKGPLIAIGCWSCTISYRFPLLSTTFPIMLASVLKRSCLQPRPFPAEAMKAR